MRVKIEERRSRAAKKSPLNGTKMSVVAKKGEGDREYQTPPPNCKEKRGVEGGGRIEGQKGGKNQVCHK